MNIIVAKPESKRGFASERRIRTFFSAAMLSADDDTQRRLRDAARLQRPSSNSARRRLFVE